MSAPSRLPSPVVLKPLKASQIRTEKFTRHLIRLRVTEGQPLLKRDYIYNDFEFQTRIRIIVFSTGYPDEADQVDFVYDADRPLAIDPLVNLKSSDSGHLQWAIWTLPPDATLTLVP